MTIHYHPLKLFSYQEIEVSASFVPNTVLVVDGQIRLYGFDEDFTDPKDTLIVEIVGTGRPMHSKPSMHVGEFVTKGIKLGETDETIIVGHVFVRKK